MSSGFSSLRGIIMRIIKDVALSAIVLVLLVGCASHRVTFPTHEYADIPQLRGHLLLPEGAGPYPAVVIVHGCSGILPSHSMWARWLQNHGYASLIVDGFTPRRVSEVCTKHDRLPTAKRVLDAYAALTYLGDLTEIDGERIGIMGFSNGGVVTMDVASRLTVNRHRELPYRFAVAIAFYPECRFRSFEYGIPTKILIGALDDWTLARSCTMVINALARSSAPVELEIYPGAHHGFDNLVGVRYLPDVQNINRGRGATVGGDTRALSRSREDTLEFLSRFMPAR